MEWGVTFHGFRSRAVPTESIQLSISNTQTGLGHHLCKQVTDEMLDAFAAVGLHDEIVGKIKERFGSYAGSVGLSIPIEGDEDRERLAGMIKELQAA